MSKRTTMILLAALAAGGCEERGVPSRLVFRGAPLAVEAGTSTTIHVQALDGAGAPLDGVEVRWIVPQLTGVEARGTEGETGSAEIQGLSVHGVAHLVLDVGESAVPSELPITASTDDQAAVSEVTTVRILERSRELLVVPAMDCAVVGAGVETRVRAQVVRGGRPGNGVEVTASVVPPSAPYLLGEQRTGTIAVRTARTDVEGAVTDGIVEVAVTATATASPAVLFFDIPGSDRAGASVLLAGECP